MFARSHSRKGVMRDPSVRSSGRYPERGGEGRREASGSGTGREVSTGARDCTPQRNGNVLMCPENGGDCGGPTRKRLVLSGGVSSIQPCRIVTERGKPAIVIA